ncbi:response regulator [Tanticharoenia sakaeratensis]|uniref:histidine kinase n=1 Tax=Tanticharoenia sakaeratensis NBRC 103193 TaxID=1231623 RepID=A0A0D6MKC1_9PROT|nr:response regulator [Tanticharoenia sakaeratensis]GAN53723.1 PAS/PAC sensor hybrid histidine kinase [Tanticharoenia sakaeratensis NBRC 103193]GBQ17086.1 two component hybrid sensor histidine kinase and regulator [Tanticharoenia sakaeratensis NBRC 103193]
MSQAGTNAVNRREGHYPQRAQILLVDDEPEILVALADLFEDDFDLLTSTDPLAALDLLARNPDVAVIVSDQRMPGLNGDAFLARARQVSDAKGILLTGYADLASVASALNQGRIQFYAHKPWEAETLGAMVREAAAHHRLERALLTERVLLRGLMDNLPMRLVFTDEHGVSMRRNDRPADEATALPEETGAAPWEQALIGMMRARVSDVGRDERLVQDPQNGHWHEILRVALPWPEGEEALPHHPAWQVSIDRDVSERVQLQTQLRQSEKMRALGTLAGGIAHDFNNLLTAVIGSLELLDDLLPEDTTMRRLLENATGSARRGATLTRRLLDFSRPTPTTLRPVDVAQLLRSMEDLLAQSMIRPGMGSAAETACRVVMAPVLEAVPLVQTDASQLEMAILNLCINARDAMDQGGTITIALHRGEMGAGDPILASGPYVVLSVRDQGCGMTREVAERVFEPFFTTKGTGRGTGLGLSTIFGFLRQNGGDIRVETAPGEGTEVRLWLPLAKGVPGAQNTELPDAAHTCVGQCRVLVVDDEAMVRLVTEGFLRREGYVVEGVGSGEAALARLDSGPPVDLVVLDLLMPGMNGRDCGAAIRARGGRMPRIMYASGYADAASWPMDAPVLAKPFTPAALNEAVRRALA